MAEDDIPKGTPPVPPRVAKVSNPEIIADLAYYHPNLKSMDQLRQVMIPYVSQNGSYLLRDSFSKAGVYTVSVMHGNNGIKHFGISRSGNSYYLQDKHFVTIDQLVKYYHHSDVPNVEHITGVRLYHPIKYVEETLGPMPSRKAGSVPSPKSGPLPPVPGPAEYLTDHQSAGTPKKTVIIKDGKSEAERKRQIFQQKQASIDPVLPIKAGKAPFKKTKSEGQIPTEKIGTGGFFSRFKKKPEDSNAKAAAYQRSKSSSIEERPPMPLPREADHQRGKSTAEKYDYDIIRDVDEDKLPELMSRLNRHGSTSRCDCGLYFDESELPRGWSIHISKDVESEGRLFFMSPEGDTAWNLPLEVSVELSPDQQDKIRELLQKHTAFHTRPGAGNRADDSGYVVTAPSSGGSASGSADSHPGTRHPPHKAGEDDDVFL